MRIQKLFQLFDRRDESLWFNRCSTIEKALDQCLFAFSVLKDKEGFPRVRSIYGKQF